MMNLLFSSSKALRVEILEIEEEEAISLAKVSWTKEEEENEEEELVEELALLSDILGIEEQRGG